MQEAVLAPAASQHVPVACVCLLAAPPNAQCGLAVGCFVRCLTIQSRGLAPASRVKPLISNVRHQKNERLVISRSLAVALAK